MTKIPSTDKSRLTHINFTTNDLYNSVDIISEALVDKDYTVAKMEAQELIKKCKTLADSIMGRI
jgi:hypothetical protein